MKHILPILTAALALTATAAIAAPTYTEETFLQSNYAGNYSFYVDPDVTTDTKTQTIDYGKYQVVKFAGDWNTATLKYQNYFKIHANEDINFYLYDFVDNVQSGDNSANALNGVNETAGKRAVQMIGYRETAVVTNPDTGVQTVITSNEKIHPLGNPTDTESVQRQYADGKTYEIVRNSYYLGKFEAEKDYEIFVSYEADGSDGVWSNTGSISEGYYLYDVDENDVATVNYPGGVVPVDTLMWAYKNGSFSSDGMSEKDVLAKNFEAANAMPIAQLNNVYFGMRAVGSPLPGGLPIALVAGLFGLGFWYIRRRKAVAA